MFTLSAVVGETGFATDYFLIVGGGPSPFSNQVSLESNVLYAQKVLEKVRDDHPEQHIYFADGKIDKPDLQFRDPTAEMSPAVMWLTRLFGDPDSAGYRYRNHAVANVSGPARKSHIKQKFYELANELTAGDRLIVYVTAHGGSSEFAAYDEEMLYGNPYYETGLGEVANEHDTTISLWNGESLKVSELDAWLNKFSRDVQVVLIMAQCHSGGFAHAIFHHAEKDRGLNPQLRIGFFSQRHDRAAAGCTPEIDESNYHEYSTYFWEAIGGMTRAGDPIDSADFNQDGVVSLSEAHAHAIISCNTLDIPVSASEAFLRKYSRIAPMSKDDEAADEVGFFGALFGGGAGKKTDEAGETSEEQPLSRDQTIAQLMEIARPEQRAVISKISEAAKVKPEETVARVRRRASKLETEAEAATQLWAATAMVIDTERGLLAGSVALQWPELGSEQFSPKMADFITTQADEFVSFIESQPQSDSYLQAVEQAKAKEAKMNKAIDREARMRRLLQTLEDVLLENNLPFHANESQQHHYEDMLAAEQQGLDSP